MREIFTITTTELWLVNTTLRERYGQSIEIEQGDADIRLSPADRELTTCPMLHWQFDQCHFVIFKVGDQRYRCQFFYRLYQQYGTGRQEYNDLAECMVDLLQVQADHDAQERGVIPSKRRR